MDNQESIFEKLRNTVRGLVRETAEPTEAPTFAPTAPGTERQGIKSLDISNGAIVINGVELPQLVADQLKMLGIPLAYYNAGQLKAAKDGCAFDCNLVDDGEGMTFDDMLTLTDEERTVRRAVEPIRVLAMDTFGVVDYGGHFTSRLQMERIRSFAQALAGPEPLHSSF